MSSGTESDDDSPALTNETMSALLEYYKEQQERENKLQEIASGIIPDSFEEDWSMSKFSHANHKGLKILLECTTSSTTYVKINEIRNTWCTSVNEMDFEKKVKVLEYDTRFAVYKEDFVFYDFKSPINVPQELREGFDVVVADPPYLSDECLTKTAITVKYIAKSDAKIILCTGGIMEDLANRLLGVKKCQFEIKHDKGLSNPFLCYSNYDLDTYCRT
ncbi:unnamed protein product, partial [Meganyctiphanes norvegica]